MSTMDCENVRQAAMALADGETSPLSARQIQSHLTGCPECRHATEELGSLSCALDSQSRREPTVDLWPRIQTRLAGRASVPLAGRFALLVAVLLLTRGIVLITAQPLEWVARGVALLLVGGWFFLLRENPFAIHSQLFETKEMNP